MGVALTCWRRAYHFGAERIIIDCQIYRSSQKTLEILIIETPALDYRVQWPIRMAFSDLTVFRPMLYGTSTNAARLATFIVALSVQAGCDISGDGAGDTLPSGNDVGAVNFVGPLAQKPQPRSCSVEDLNQWVHDSMQDYYLFHDQVDPNADANSADSPEAFIQSLRVTPNDTFSYVTDESTYTAFFSEGETMGYGWNFARDSDDALLFSLINPGSPLAEAGVLRGDELLSINDISMDDFSQLSSQARQDIIGTGNDVRTITLTIASAGSANREVTVTRAVFSLQTVLDAQVIQRNGANVGYLHFYQFINNSSAELEQAFATFNAADVSELVIDLRFNGGGRIAIANELASYVVGDGHTNDVFTTFAYNDKYQDRNVSVYFQQMLDSLSLGRVFVLQSENTCSASELVVNSLRPFIEVVTVGSTSCGKPYATSPNIACGKVVNALEIDLLNASGTGGYFDGIAADCPVSENVRLPLGDASEPLLGTALNYIDTGSCGFMARQLGSDGHSLTVEFKDDWQGGNSL